MQLIKTLEKPRFITGRIQSIKYALEGIQIFLLTEMNARVHLAATLLVAIGIIIFPVSRWEIIALLFAVAIVWVSEMINTAIEKAMDLVSPQFNPKVKHIKDISAGAVLVASIASWMIGAFIFIPKIILP